VSNRTEPAGFPVIRVRVIIAFPAQSLLKWCSSAVSGRLHFRLVRSDPLQQVERPPEGGHYKHHSAWCTNYRQRPSRKSVWDRERWHLPAQFPMVGKRSDYGLGEVWRLKRINGCLLRQSHGSTISVADGTPERLGSFYNRWMSGRRQPAEKLFENSPLLGERAGGEGKFGFFAGNGMTPNTFGSGLPLTRPSATLSPGRGFENSG